MSKETQHYGVHAGGETVSNMTEGKARTVAKAYAKKHKKSARVVDTRYGGGVVICRMDWDEKAKAVTVLEVSPSETKKPARPKKPRAPKPPSPGPVKAPRPPKPKTTRAKGPKKGSPFVGASKGVRAVKGDAKVKKSATQIVKEYASTCKPGQDCAPILENAAKAIEYIPAPEGPKGDKARRTRDDCARAVRAAIKAGR